MLYSILCGFDSSHYRTFPSDFLKLPNLRHLILQSTQFNGRVPTEVAAISSLQSIDLSYNDLIVDLPDVIGRFSFVTKLALKGVKIGGTIPASIGSMPNLEEINLSSCKLTGTVPASLWALSKLRSLEIGDNSLQVRFAFTLILKNFMALIF